MINQFIEFITTLKHIGLEYYNKYYAIYPAIVEDTNDPEKRGRIKISLPSILEEGEILSNWCDPAGQPLAGDQTGQFMPPYEGDVVDVVFENGDLNFPKYFGGFWAQEELPPDFSDGYGENGPDVRGWVFKSGQKILVDETDGQEVITIYNKDGSTIVMDSADGTITINTTQDTKIVAQGNVSVEAQQDCSVNAQGKVDVTSGSDCTVTAGGKVEVTSSADATVNASGSCNIKAGGDCKVDASSISLNGSSGEILTTMTMPLVDNITGQPSVGVPTVTAG
jgi:hypothetical protein